MNLKSRAVWTLAEVQFLTSNYKLLSADKIAEKLKRTAGSVSTKIQKLGLVEKLKTATFLKKDDAFFKVWETSENTPIYIGAQNSLQAIEKFLKIKNILKKIRDCEKHEAKIVCQGNDMQRTKKYYKFI